MSRTMMAAATLCAAIAANCAVAQDQSAADATPAGETTTGPRHSSEFVPSKHGFRFVNRFEGVPPLPRSLRDERTTIGAIAKLVAQTAGAQEASYGLCGGMSAAAADWFLSGADRPGSTTVPERGSRLFEYLVQRQTDSLGLAGLMAVKFAEWMVLPDAADEFGGVEGRTAAELPRLVERLEAGELVPLGLVYTRAGESAIWNNHQVLAIGCERKGDRTVEIRIYDPNWPGDDDARVRTTLTHPLGEARGDEKSAMPVNRATSKQTGSRGRERSVRGFFAMPYSPRRIDVGEPEAPAADARPPAN